MIELRCFYCGRLMRAEESGAYRRVTCPECGRSVPVPGHNPRNPRHGGSPAPDHTPNDAQDWASKSNEEIAQQLLTRRREPEDANAWGLRTLLSPLLPRCDSLTLFIVSVALLWLVLIDRGIRQDLPAVFQRLGGYGAPLLSILLAFGMACSLLGVFRRRKSHFEKQLMVLFAIHVSAGTGLYAGWLMLRQGPLWLTVFPAWNIANGLALLALDRARAIGPEYIAEGKVTFGQVVTAALAMFLLLATCRYLFGLHGSATCSIALAYMMNLHHVLGPHKILSFWKARGDQD